MATVNNISVNQLSASIIPRNHSEFLSYICFCPSPLALFRIFVIAMAPSPLPEFVYKIVPSAPPTPIPSQYPLSELDQKDGFVHLSIGTQIPITAGLFFKEATSIWVLKIRFDPKFHSATTWEIEGCPHLYGNFGVDDVEALKEFSRLDGQTWKESMQDNDGFLV
ncbi:uncharacterized protein GGS22DRAFT_130831 [Annulohypoxylon maeteangense]|uniref:uncharacterized protein n=1 Tax=Annulohypoxylon maeteangense TaxID=1927788 RepID=UPI0020084426|nr:uncharacterized protein GGS22DRAFT_130831 [Annulohypoxylon maeteangense]KAI0885576.1 hypothetical protein GGS22DRAFT_130831 [Annulohypoxylon maeteangense]